MQPMTHLDLDRVLTIQRKAHEPFFHESRKAFASKLNIYPAGCWIETRGGRAAGYLFSHPWSLANPPGLHEQLIALPDVLDCFYIHDLAVDPNFKDRGIGLDLAEKAIALSRECKAKFGVSTAALIAVGDSFSFWVRFGFKKKRRLSPAMEKKRAFYGPDACLMIKDIP